MKEGSIHNYTPEQKNELRAKRTLANAQAIEDGAEFVEDGRLEFTGVQVLYAKDAMRKDKTRQKIGDYLNDATLDSPRFQAFSDFIDWGVADGLDKSIREVVQWKIRQLRDKNKVYDREYSRMFDIVEPYRIACMHGRSSPWGANSKFQDGLKKIRDTKIEEKSQPSKITPSK